MCNASLDQEVSLIAALGMGVEEIQMVNGQHHILLLLRWRDAFGSRALIAYF
jgi:hypothetical protein